MKKLIYIMPFLLTIDSLQAQYQYKVEANYTTSTGVVSVYSIRLKNNANSVEVFNMTSNLPNTNEQVDEVVNLNFIPNEIEFFGANPTVVSSSCNNTSTYGYSIGNLACASTPFYNLNLCYAPTGYSRFIPIKSLQAVNDPLSLVPCESKTILAADCAINYTFSYSVDYQYGNNTTSWQELLPYAPRSSEFEIQLSDFTGLAAGQNLRLRINYEPGTNSVNEILPIATLNCSPTVISQTTSPTSCLYTDDGTFSVTFDRALDPNEVLNNVTLYSEGADGILNTGDDITEQFYSSLSYSGTTLVWPGQLASGNYRLSYQSGNSNLPENYFPIMIEAPPTGVSFSATGSNLTCFQNGSGEINITASGGTGSYEYSINNGTTYLPFQNTSNHSIQGLDATIPYLVKVRDTNGCTEQN